MNQTTIKKISLTLLATLVCGVVMAQSWTAPAYKGPMVYRPEAPPAGPPFYSNLGSTTCTGCNYDTNNGGLLIGPANCYPPTAGLTQWLAVPFLSAKAGTVRRVQVAVTLDSALCTNGQNRFVCFIATDSCAGPGTQLGSTANAIAPAAPCALAAANFGTTGAVLAANTQYWVVVETAAQTGFTGVWWQSYHENTAFNLNDTNGWIYPASFGPNDLAMTVL